MGYSMEVVTIKESYFACLTYLVIKDNQCIIVDAGASLQNIKKAINKFGIKKVCGVLITHAHFDHLYSLEDYDKEFSCPIYISKKGIKNLQDPIANHSFSSEKGIINYTSKNIVGISSKNFNIEDFGIEVVVTDGHTNDSVCYIVDKEVMFTGDTIFYNAIGRTDLINSDFSSMLKSLKKLRKYDGFNKYYPGHGKVFTAKDMLSYLASMGIF